MRRWGRRGGALLAPGLAAAGAIALGTGLTAAYEWSREGAEAFVAEAAGDCTVVPVHADGRPVGSACAETARNNRLTLLDLSDDWLPALFSETPDKKQRLRRQLLSLANEQAGHGRDRSERDLELHGIFPSFTVIGRRLLDDERHLCHDAVADAALVAPGAGPQSVRAAQEHLRCEGLLDRRARPGRLDHATRTALGDLRRRHMLPGATPLDDEMRALLSTDSRELDFRALLRALRERVGDAAGLLEDGTAAGKIAPVLGRVLDASELRLGFERAALTPVRGRAAPDLVGPATESVARALGWTSPEAARAWFSGRRRGSAPAANGTPAPLGGPGGFDLPERIAVRLPPAPSYHAAHMDLRVEVDRGDVWLASPVDGKAPPPKGRRPSVTIYVRDGGAEIALVRWPTTIGGWQPFEEPDGSLSYRYGESRAGEAFWRDLWAAPAWYPPAGIPGESLVERRGGALVPRNEIVGPGPRAAYGLVALVHHEPNRRGGEPADHGIRMHGSPAFLSIARGESHGCHRLYNHLAIRLGGFLLHHRNHVRHGTEAQRFQRIVSVEDEEVKLTSDHRGYRYELTPPVPVRVLRGSVHGSRAAIAEPVPIAPPPSPPLSLGTAR